MCELFGASFRVPFDLRNELHTFYSHSVKHPHGWGIMYEKDGRNQIQKEFVRAIDSEMLPSLIEEMQPQKNVLGHIRLATIGSVCPVNVHPFTGTDITGTAWTMIHNGTIYSSRTLVPYFEKQTGDTDSERILLYFLDLLQQEFESSGSLTINQRIKVVDELVHELSHRNKLNIMFFDGEVLYFHKNMRDTLCQKVYPEGIVVSTTALGEGWTDVELCRMFAYHNGKCVYRSEEATIEFIPNLDYINALAALNI